MICKLHGLTLSLLGLTLLTLLTLLTFADRSAADDGTAEADSKPQESAPASSGDAASTEPTTTPGVQFEEDFRSATGATLITTNGRDQQQEGDLAGMYSAFASVPEGQPRPLTLRVVEDDATQGPDGKPGVLRLQMAEVPLQTNHSGFLMSGNQDDGKLRIPGWTLGQVTLTDLRRTFVEFKFRADNPSDPDRFGSMCEFRIEPDIQNPYPNRADFGVLIATQRWRTFRRPIGSATNLETFLRATNEKNPPNFKLVWSQHGPIQGYFPGDSLLIDDIRIIIE